MTKRKGAVRRADIPPAILARLNRGEIETATLAEGLAIDFAALFSRVAPEAADAAGALDPAEGITRRMQRAGALLLRHVGPQAARKFASHPSDTVRGWAAYAVGLDATPSLAERLVRVRPFADDPHFAVREWAWMAVRPRLAESIDEAIAFLVPWTADPSDRVRRFAVESTRPRGVWCAHIEALKRAPRRGLPLLEPLRADPARYVQDSVANWLNDAGKSDAAWVVKLCARWRRESPGPATERICRRATRSLR